MQGSDGLTHDRRLAERLERLNLEMLTMQVGRGQVYSTLLGRCTVKVMIIINNRTLRCRQGGRVSLEALQARHLLGRSFGKSMIRYFI